MGNMGIAKLYIVDMDDGVDYIIVAGSKQEAADYAGSDIDPSKVQYIGIASYSLEPGLFKSYLRPTK